MAVQLTTAAKTVADCFRFRRHVGLDIALAALKDLVKALVMVTLSEEATEADERETRKALGQKP